MTLMPQRWMTFFTMPVGRVAVVALLLALASGETAYGQDRARESLRGVGPVYVVIETLAEDATGIGLSEAGLEAAVELQLRRNGVPLAAWRFSSVFLYVNVLVLSRALPIVSTVMVQFKQLAVLEANGRIEVVTTWTNAETMKLPTANEARDRIRDLISEYVDIFSNDYLAVNPQP